MSPPRLPTALRTHLAGQGIVRARPSDGGSLPPLWLQPRFGVPAPGETPTNGAVIEAHPDVVAGAFLSGGFPVGRFESEWRYPTIEIRVRGRTAPLAEDLAEQITAAVIDRTDFDMGGRRIAECQMWRALTPIDSDTQSFDYLVAYRFHVYTTV